MRRHEYARAAAAGDGYCTACGAVSPHGQHATTPQPCPACGAAAFVDIRHAHLVGALTLERAFCVHCNAQHSGDPESAVCTTCGQAAGVVWR